MGDFKDLKNYYDSISDVTQLKPMISFSTRGNNVLDQLFTNLEGNDSPQKLSPIGHSDHCSVLWRPFTSSHEFREVRVCKFSKKAFVCFNEAVNSFDWLALVNDFPSVDDAMNAFQKCLVSFYESFSR